MRKKILIGITILLISGLLTGWYFFTREAKYFGTSAFRAVPENVSVILRIHHLGNYSARSLNNPIWKAYSGFPGVAALYKKLGFADSLINLYPEVKDIFIDKDLTIAFDKENDHFENLCLVELSSLSEKRALSGLVEAYFVRKGAATEKVKSGEAKLYCYSWDENGQHQNYCISFYQGLFLASADRRMVAQAVSTLESPAKLGSSVFEKANKSATDNIDLNIYLNHKKLLLFAQSLFSASFWERLKGSSPLAEWSEIDLTQKSNEFLFNGFSFTGESLSNYLGIFLHQKPGSFNLAGLFPAETSFFLSYIISNTKQFFHDYESLLEKQNRLDEYKSALTEINTLYNVDLQKIVADNLEGAAAIVFTRPDQAMPDENKYLVMRVGRGSKMEEAMLPLTKAAGSNGNRDLSENSILYRIDKETVFKVYKTPVSDFGKKVFGDIFGDVVTNYFTIYDNCLVMGSSYVSIGRFLRQNVLQETLANTKIYHDFTAGLSDRQNFYLWSSPGRSLPFFKEIVSNVLYQSIENQMTGLNKIESVGWQIGIENGMVYNMARLKYNPDTVRENTASVIWRSHIGNQLLIKPQYVINSADKSHKEIVVQDSAFNFILISSEGRTLWKIKLRGPIRSDIFQLNCFRDGKLQYFFSTDEALHLIDHEGNYIRNFPLALRSVATNGVSVIDYEGKGDYRFFIAGKDHKVYLYDKKGKIVPDWAPQKTEHSVNQPVQFFRVNNKDYIVFADKNRGYILDRKGKPRVIIKGDIAYSQNRFTLEPGSGKRAARLVTTDSKGCVVMIGFDGSVKRLSMGNFSSNHFFIYDPLNSDNKRNYIFLDGDSLAVYDMTAKQIFSQKFKHSIGLAPELYTFPDNSRKIGIVDSADNHIYLFNDDGSLHTGFPLEGNSRFSVGLVGEENTPINLITGTFDGYLNNYQIQ